MIAGAHHDPAGMPPAERVAEIAHILAAGYLRIVRRRAENRLDDLDDDTAPCKRGVHREPRSKEVA
jgi:hypothetical protein